jgi:hypothetical protein
MQVRGYDIEKLLQYTGTTPSEQWNNEVAKVPSAESVLISYISHRLNNNLGEPRDRKKRALRVFERIARCIVALQVNTTCAK